MSLFGRLMNLKNWREYVDSTCKNSNRAYYYPSHPPDGKPRRLHNLTGKLVNKADLLEFYIEPKKPAYSKSNFQPVNSPSGSLSQLDIQIAKKLRKDKNERKNFAEKNSIVIVDGVAKYFVCPKCGRKDATFFYIDGTGAYCAHQNSCRWRGSLFELGTTGGYLL